VIDAGAAARIAAHEGLGGQRARRPYLLYAVGGLGALSIGIGLLSIVASNWDAIPAGVKLGLDLVLLLGLSAAILRADEGKSGWVRETLLLVFYGAVLASIGLVAQVYHLGGAAEDALLFWSVITAPIVLHGQGRLLAAVWLIATQSVIYAEILRALDRTPRQDAPVVFLTAAFLLTLVLGALGESAWLRGRKPAFASVAGVLARVQLMGIATVFPLAWYERSTASAAALGFVALAVVAAGAGALAVRTTGDTPTARVPLVVLAVAAPVMSYLPLLADHDHQGVPAAVSFLLLWSLYGFAAYRLGRYRALNVATALLAIRLLIVYFEVFGSLLDTGIGLLTGGLLTVFLAWVWVKKSPRAPAGGGRPA
jgi:uncharacterized membrane protein